MTQTETVRLLVLLQNSTETNANFFNTRHTYYQVRYTVELAIVCRYVHDLNIETI